MSDDETTPETTTEAPAEEPKAPKAKKGTPEPEGYEDRSNGKIRSTLPVPNPAPVKG